MLLNELKTDYFSLSYAEKFSVISAYREKRFMELDSPVEVVKKAKTSSASKGTKKAALSSDEKALLKALGVSLATLKKME